MTRYNHILLMKAGPYCGYGLEEIIKIKQKEERAIGKFFWGYSGVFCRPGLVNAFVKSSQSSKVIGLFIETKSSYSTTEQGKFTEFSEDKIHWQKLPKQVLLVGNTRKPHFAVCGKNLKRLNKRINLSDYKIFMKTGLFPHFDKTLNNYFRSRVDKALGVYSLSSSKDESSVEIKCSYELIEPYCVYIR
ncbi:MAG: hypothetical protein UU61_C0031G0007 [Parcubacteria group bacterium GW2011_GWB1_41_4]|nr:MAG: hypothetical protein UU61_C0031G0007 [Parcubacteria group bacterium GW2011_GWB1_41_4]